MLGGAVVAQSSPSPVCTENSILIDYVIETPNVSGNDRAALLLADPVRLAVQATSTRDTDVLVAVAAYDRMRETQDD